MRKILDKLCPIGTKRRTALFQLKKKTKKIIKNCAIDVYRLIPSKKLKKMAKKMGLKVGLTGLDKFNTSKDSYVIYDKWKNIKEPVEKLESTNKKIAVHLHLYYPNLLDEFIGYLNNIPYKFDLYVSTTADANRKEINTKLKNINNVNKVIVKSTKNSGRDYGPMMVEFGNFLDKYDYICHIHTKKSVRTGMSQDVWRHQLLDGVLGSEDLVKRIFYTFEKLNVGIFFPDTITIDIVPYWCHTWLGASEIGRQVCSEIGIPFKDSYLDFSAGSMFWVKKDAIHQVLSRRWNWKDFGEEKGMNDGNLAYVFERIFTPCCIHNGYDYICYNQKKEIFYRNFSERNMTKYYEKSLDSAYEELSKFEVISFDIFDTLLTRKIYNPNDLFILAGEQLKEKINLKKSFLELRKEAEIKANLNPKMGDPDIHQIYQELQKINKFTDQEISIMKEKEIELEKKFLIPRKDMLEIFNRLKEQGKRIIITSDMYLTSDILEDILKNCGYTGYEKIFVSCELNKRKDKGNIWEDIIKYYPKEKIIHVGDNEESDIHMLWDYGIANYHVMQGRKMFENSNYGYLLRKNSLNTNNLESILYGLIINKKLFNSPFKFHKAKNEYLIENLEEYGYCIVGPILLEYLLWILKSEEVKKDETSLLFLSREGYYLKRLYEILESGLKQSKVEKSYFLTSRRCVTVANIRDRNDISDILDIEYFGNLKDFLKYRFNINYSGKNFNVSLSKEESIVSNRSRVETIINKIEEDIIKEASEERKNYLKYIDKTIKQRENKNLIVIDLGYSGTTQVYLSNLLNQKVAGKYLVVKNNPKPLAIGCKVESCFNELENDNNHLLYKNSLFLECFLTAPNGQLMYFDSKVKPVYTQENSISEKMNQLDEIYNGIKNLFEDMIDLCNEELLSSNFDKENLVKLYQAFLLESKYFIDQNNKIFTFEDYYCRSEKIVIEKQ